MTAPTPDPYPAAPAPHAGAGRIAVIFGAVVIVISLLRASISYAIPYLMNELALGSGQVGIVFSIVAIIEGVFALVAVIFGASALSRRGPDAALGGIGFGVGLLALVTTVVGLLAAPLTSLILG